MRRRYFLRPTGGRSVIPRRRRRERRAPLAPTTMKTTTTTTTCDESTALLRDPSAKTAQRSVASRVGLALGLCAAIVLAWATVTTEDAEPNAPMVAEPPFWATVDVGDGRELSARAYAAFLKRRLAEDALSEDGLMTRRARQRDARGG